MGGAHKNVLRRAFHQVSNGYKHSLVLNRNYVDEIHPLVSFFVDSFLSQIKLTRCHKRKRTVGKICTMRWRWLPPSTVGAKKIQVKVSIGAIGYPGKLNIFSLVFFWN